MSPNNIFDDEFLNKNKSSSKKRRGKSNGLKNKKTAVVHTKLDADVDMALAYLKKHGVNFENFIFETHGGNNGANNISIKDSVSIDVLHGALDHHGLHNKTALHMAVEKIGEHEEWLKPILSRLLRIDSYGESLFGDIGTIAKAMVHTDMSNQEMLKRGVTLGTLILEFHERNLERDHNLTKNIISNYFMDKKLSMPEAFKRYLQLLDNPRFQRFTDLCEILSAKAEIDGKKTAKRLGEELVSLLYQEFGETYRKGEKEALKKAVRIRIDEKRKDFIAVVITDNPKTHTALLKMGAVAVIQRDSNGNHQLFFNSKMIRKPTTDCIVYWIRKLELFLSGKNNFGWEDLISPETLISCPEWHYFLGEEKRNRERGIFILNGSLTAPDVPPSKINLEAITTIVWLCLNKK